MLLTGSDAEQLSGEPARLRQLVWFDLATVCTAIAVMSGTYNTRPLIPEVLVDGGRYHIIRPRQSLEDLIGLDSVPDWL